MVLLPPLLQGLCGERSGRSEGYNGRVSTGIIPAGLPFLSTPVSLAEFLDELGSSPEGELNISFGACEEGELSIAASEGGRMPSEVEDSAGLPPSSMLAQSEADVELAAVLARSATSFGLE